MDSPVHGKPATQPYLLLELQHAGLVLGLGLLEPRQPPQQQVQKDEHGRLQVVAVVGFAVKGVSAYM